MARKTQELATEPVLTVQRSEVEDGKIELTREALISVLQKAGYPVASDADVTVDSDYDETVVYIRGGNKITVTWKTVTPKA